MHFYGMYLQHTNFFYIINHVSKSLNNNFDIFSKKSRFLTPTTVAGIVRQRRPPRARLSQDLSSSHLRQVLGLESLHQEADKQHLPTFYLRNGTLQRSRRASRDSWEVT